jgi:branched-chain amino acid transport system permease protein
VRAAVPDRVDFVFQILVNGTMAGLVYVLMALGFTLIFGIMRVVNFAHGELYMVAAYAVFLLNGALGLNYFAALAAAALLVGLFGVVLERLLFRPLLGMELNGMIMALAVSITLQALALIVFGPMDLAVPRPVAGVVRLGAVVFPLDRLLVAACALVTLFAFYMFLQHSRLGLAMRAVAQDEPIAAVLGVRPHRIHSAAFGIAAGLAALAGGLMAPVYTVLPYMGELPMLKAFVVVVLGGLGSIPGAVVGGLLIGMTESVFATLADTIVASIVSFAIVVVIIAFRPQGLMGQPTR